MSTTELHAQEVSTVSQPLPVQQRGLSLRSFVVAVFALLLTAMWVEYQERFVSGGPLMENSPPNGVMAAMMLILLIGAILYRFRRSLQLNRTELVFIYCALLVAAPLYTQGLWTRFFGIISAIPHTGDFKSLESLPSMLWPHGDNLISNGRFESKLQDFSLKPANHKVGWQTLEWKGKSYACPVLDNGNKEGGQASLLTTIPRYDANGVEQLVPGEKFMLHFLVKASALQSTSSYYVSVQGSGQPVTVLRNVNDTPKTVANPSGLQRVGVTPLTIPTEIDKKLTIEFGLKGPGQIALLDLQCFNINAVEGGYTGVHVASESTYELLRQQNEYDNTIVKPDRMFSLSGVAYLLKGFTPWGQWIKPLFAWTVLIGALFIGFLGFNVLMRKQWVENERFSFPMNLVPRYLFGEEPDLSGKVTGLLRNKVMWLGFAVVLPLVLLKGFHFYNPAVPTLFVGDLRLDSLVTNPLLKTFLQNFTISMVFSLLAIALLIDTDLLFSIWVSFTLFQFMYLFGKLFQFSRYAGYPWEWSQAIGSFTAFAFLAIWTGRRHLQKVLNHVIGRKTDLDDREEVVKYRTALLLIILSILLLVAWGVWTKMGPWISLLYFGWMLVCGLTASKVRAEVGMPFGYWMPYFGMLFVSALGGFAVFGPTGMLVATIASGFMMVSCFLYLAPVQVEMMELGRFFKVRPRDINYGLFLGLMGGLVIGGFVLLCWSYGKGGENLVYSWPYDQNWYFQGYRMSEVSADRAFANGEVLNPQTAPLDMIHNVDAKGLGIGAVVTGILALLRNTFMWFPLHPLGYVLATTFFIRGMWFTLFSAWLIRMLVLRIGGAHAIRRGLVPFCVGMFLACIISIIIFDVLGIYLQAAQQVTEVYGAWP